MYVLVLGLDVLGNPFGVIRGLSEGVEAFFYEPFQVKHLAYCEIHMKPDQGGGSDGRGSVCLPGSRSGSRGVC